MLDIAIVTDEIALDIRTAIAEGRKMGVRNMSCAVSAAMRNGCRLLIPRIIVIF